jgi:uncharacterized protein
MQIQLEAMIPRPASAVWAVLLDVPVIAGCIPGCEQVVELEHLVGYSAVLKQKLGVFKVELPAVITVREVQEPVFMKLEAAGTDKFTGTKITIDLHMELKDTGNGQSLMVALGDMRVAGKLASLAFSIIKKKAEENFAEFKVRILKVLELPDSAGDQSTPHQVSESMPLEMPDSNRPEPAHSNATEPQKCESPVAGLPDPKPLEVTVPTLATRPGEPVSSAENGGTPATPS